MKRTLFSLFGLLAITQVSAQQAASPTHPAVYSWLQNTTETGTFYNQGNSTAQNNGILVNCQEVEYSNDFVYAHTEGVPAYTTGPFLDGNPSAATAQGDVYKIPLNPTPSNNPSNTTGGTIGVFVNGVSLFDYRDGVAWNPSTNALCGGPGNPMCPGGPTASMDWNRDAIPAEMGGFDCSKAHPAMGNYHHHQNPSAFDLDQNVVSTICNLYDAEGLYAINTSEHSPLLGFAYDGYPIYGAYGYATESGTGVITRIKSGYELSTATTRANGPDVNATYFNGYFREDYTWVAHSGEEEYLDEHNGRNCVTPEYPGGIYAYFCTIDEDWNSVYPYAVGPTFYGTYANRSVTSVTEATTVYTPPSVGLTEAEEQEMDVVVFPNPASDLVALQVKGLVKENLAITVLDITGKVIAEDVLTAGTTIWYLDTKTLYDGVYIIKIGNTIAKQVTVARN
ncbi:MAG: hypothetical protein ACI9UR_000113 [Bacteroidia bacterium]|jgi:hypothetical protein